MSFGYAAETKTLSNTKSYLQRCVKPRHSSLLCIRFLEAKYPDLRREHSLNVCGCCNTQVIYQQLCLVRDCQI